MNDETQERGGQFTTSFEETRAYLEARMHSIIREEIAHEEEQRFRQLKWVIAVVGIIGIGTFGTLANYFIGVAVDSRLEARSGQISEALEFVKFQALSNKLELGTTFSDSERDAVMNYLRNVAEDDVRRHTPEFLGALQQTTAGSTGQRNTLVEMLRG